MRSWLLMLTLLVAACAGTAPATYPLQVQIADLRFAEPGLLEQTIGLSLRFTNPSPEPINAEGLRFVLELEGSAFGTGVSDAAFAIPRLGEVVVPVTLRVQTGALLDRLLAFDGGTVDYRLRGDLFQPSGSATGGARTLAFASDSAIAIPDLEGLLGRIQRPRALSARAAGGRR